MSSDVRADDRAERERRERDVLRYAATLEGVGRTGEVDVQPDGQKLDELQCTPHLRAATEPGVRILADVVIGDGRRTGKAPITIPIYVIVSWDKMVI